MIKGNVFNIQRFSVDDGPGIRTIVFLKGCPLSCTWCANPESQDPKAQILYFSKKCTGCGKCIQVCPQKCISPDERFGLLTDQNLCIQCGACVDHCYYGAREISGKKMTIDEVMEALLKDKEFYKNSGGGITLSGGEPFVQATFASELLKKCKEENLHTAVESCVYVPWEHIELSLDYLDLVFMDFKHWDTELHRIHTGGGNSRIIENIKRVIKSGKEHIIRIPCIPGVNDEPETLKKMILMLDGFGAKKVEILPFHRMGYNKYKGLGMEYKFGEIPPMKREKLFYLKEYQKDFNAEIIIGGK